MSESLAELQHHIVSAGELKTVVRTMKMIAAANIAQYEQAVGALAVYHATVRHGLAVALRNEALPSFAHVSEQVGVVLFGTDQGLVGQFNDAVAEFASQTLATHSQVISWVVGERLSFRLAEILPAPASVLPVPGTLSAITALVSQLLTLMDNWLQSRPGTPLLVIYQHVLSKESFQPVVLRLLPLDEMWRNTLFVEPWPGKRTPELLGGMSALQALVREYLFVSLYRACAESLASENASRLIAMQRADKNIDEMLENLRRTRQRVRQSNIDEELFDVLAGFEVQMEGG